MGEENPYESPQSELRTDSLPKSPSTTFELFITPLYGAVIGSVILFPFVRGPGDPGGHVVGAGLGGIAGVVIALIRRMLY